MVLVVYDVIMKKIRLFKLATGGYECYSCEHDSNYQYFAVGNDWWNLTDSEYDELYIAVCRANAPITNKRGYNKERPYKYFIIEHLENQSDAFEEVFASAKEFIDNQRESERKQKEAAEKKRQSAKIAAETKKRKQLEKLKKELGEE
jgi:hypothetical protein